VEVEVKKDVDGSGRGLFYGNIPEFSWKEIW
jgi:hypothetical protein